MISHTSIKGSKPQMITREKMLALLGAGLDAKAFRFTRQAALTWLTSFPGDLEVNLAYARALMKEERFSHAAPVIQKILHSDPEYAEAAVLAEAVFIKSDPTFVPFAAGTIKTLGGSPKNPDMVPEWAKILHEIRQDISKNRHEIAREKLFQIVSETEHVELVSLYHLLITKELDDRTTLLDLARLYHTRWPDCIQIALILARSWMEAGEEDEAVSLLHFCAANDPSAQVPSRMFGKNFTYRPLYPQDMQIALDIPIPAEVAGRLGLNQLSSGISPQKEKVVMPVAKTEVTSFDGYTVLPTTAEEYPQHPKGKDEVVKKKDPIITEVEDIFKCVAQKIGQPVLTHTDERFPVHVILSMKTGLTTQFGEQSSQVILDEMKNLAQTVQAKVGWTSIVFMPDDLAICGKFSVTPVDSLDPWKIKLALVDLDKALEITGQRIGSVMIVGGDQVVPFHRLPNPTEDSDSEVPSDSPYAALDTNYFVPDWPVGRLPGEHGTDSGMLVSQLRNVIRYHTEESESHSLINSLFRLLIFWDRPWLKNMSNVGYTASVWRRSSLAAFRPIGEGRNLYLSPSGNSTSFEPKKLATAPIGYFNVHGVEDGSEWYGQKDPLENGSGPDFPIALKPADLLRVSNLPRIVFCEACYGGHIFDKLETDSIALTLLGKGVMAMIGSTTISYGSVTTPLIGADLIGYLVLKNLREGLSIGAAMLKAKVEFVREMNRRQGYLDGEDQKTLISFVLYGDPLVAYDPYQAARKVTPRDLYHPQVKTISDSPTLDEQSEQLVPKMISQAKMLVKDYLPGIEYAEVRVKNQQINASNFNGLGKDSKGSYVSQPNRIVVSFSKQITQADKVHKQFARVTLDKEGKMVKLAVSR